MKLSKSVSEMRDMADRLIPHTHPYVDFSDEYDVLPLKCRSLTLDGYDILVNFSKSDYTKFMRESLQIQSYYTPFLPFHLVCKIGRSFLGSEELCYIDFVRNGKKVYCWTLRLFGSHVLPPQNYERTEFEGFSYNLLLPSSVNLY